nr:MULTISPECIES: DotA/TraY family protein [unclassified Xanthobacter]
MISLRRVIGCTVDAVWKGTTCADAGMVATAAGVFNVATSIVAALALTYTLYVTIWEMADAEYDRAKKFTFVRIGIGAGMLLPIKSGFSFAQIIVLYILVWGSGGADYLWAKVAPKMAGNGYADIATLPEDDYKIRAAIAGAIRARTQGYVCADRLNEVAVAYRVEMAPAIVSKTLGGKSMPSAGGDIQSPTQQTFVDNSGFFNGSTSLCGNVRYLAPQAVTLPEKDTPTKTADVPTMTLMDAIATSAVTSGYTAAWSIIDAYAKNLADMVKNPGYTDEQIKDYIATATWAAQAALRNALNGALTSRSGDIKTAADKYLEDTTNAGWVFAISWQRANVAMAQRFQSLVNSVTFTPKAPDNLAAVIDPASIASLLSTPRIADASTGQIYALYQHDMGRLNSFDAVFTDMASPSPTLAAEQVGTPPTNLGVSSTMRWVYDKLKVTGTEGTTQWSDPLLNMTQIGVGVADMGLAAMGVAAGASLVGNSVLGNIPFIGGIAQMTSAGASSLGMIFAGLGFWLGGVLPLLPILYFFGAVLSWIINGLEALIAVPLWLLSFFYPAKEPSLVGASRQGWLLLFGLLVRPMLIIMGLVVSLLAMYAAFAILNALFSSVFALMIPLDGGAVTSAVVTAGAVFLYVMAATMVVTNSCALMTELGDAALRWIEVGVHSIWGSQFGQQVSAQAGVGGGLGSGMQNLGKGVAGGLGKVTGNLRMPKFNRKGGGGSGGGNPGG